MFRTLLAVVTLSAVVIAHAGAASAAQTSSADRAQARTGTPAAIVNLNTASAKELDSLPGIGAKTAALIVEYRQKNGPFKKIEDILESSRSCPYLLSISRLSAHQSVSGNR